MAEINSYSAYSVLSSDSAKEKNTESLLRSKLDELENLVNIDDVKAYLQQTFNVDGANRKFLIDGGFPMNITETEKVFSVNVVIKNAHFTYCYRKGV